MLLLSVIRIISGPCISATGQVIKQIVIVNLTTSLD